MFRQLPHPRKIRLHPKVGDTHSCGETWEQDERKFEIRRSVEFSSAAARCIPWRVDGHSNGETCANKRRIRGCGHFRIWDLEFSRRGSDGETHCLSKQRRRNPMHPVNQTTREVQKLKEKNGHTIYTWVQPQFTMRKQSSRSSGKIYGREHDDPMDDLDVNMAIWGIFLNTTLQATVHLGQDCDTHLRFVKNHLWNSVGQLFNENEKLISEQTEITGVSTIDFKELTWMSTSLLCSRAHQITNAKTNVFSDSVLCVVKRRDNPIATWKRKI